ncbi:hypothetical protein [Geothrix sp. PMB-07]|uniref:aldose epimerase family protein n=1 Tax=Geothrix sp. PMB-07 TaxID=3068640 RepID=UPI002741D7B6|nr:hypothetical protein [Geothrix sp. PMB-07]WLT31610.1 hypothetical protein Q9293_18050 [Geothrix sp. PMB-07]
MSPAALTDTLSLENEQLSVRLRPGQGAKLCSLLDRRTGRDWLIPSQLPGGVYLQPTCGDDFSRFDTSGFDDCFPTVSACKAPGMDIQWPDHGELWSRPWEVTREGASLLARIDGQAWPYTFSRRVSLEGDTLCLDYTLDNRADRPFPNLWSAHPLLKVSPGMKLWLPGSPGSAFLNAPSDPAFGSHGEARPWPELLPGVDFSTVQPRSLGRAVKVFFPRVQEGTCGILEPQSGEALTFTWNQAELPHLGLWLCYGGWPDDGRPGHLTVALEPCTGLPDRLDEAAEGGTCLMLPPGGRAAWSLRLRSHHLHSRS